MTTQYLDSRAGTVRRRVPSVRRLRGAVSVFACFLLVPLAETAGRNSGASQWNNEFAGDMMLELREEHADENFAFSPFSIFTAFGMTYAGARENTAAQMEDVFRFPGQTQTHGPLAWLLNSVQAAANGEDTEFELANRAWVQEDWPVVEDFLDVLSEQYNAPVGFADFVTQWDAERERINDWVADQTRDRIEDLLPEGSVNTLTRFVLANALYFQGLWEFPFTDDTRDADFNVGDDEVVTVSMMYGDRLPVLYKATDLAEAIALPVKDDSFSFIVVLPREGVGLDETLAAIAGLDFSLNVNEYAPAGMDVYLPRFRVESEIDLKARLMALGVVDAFVPNVADFTGIHNPSEPAFYDDLHLQGAYHKTFIEVHETGLEAAAATAVVGGFTSVPPAFRVDRPFLFFVTEDTTRTILFAGQVVRPEDPHQAGASQSYSYEAWKMDHFNDVQRSNPDISGPEANPRGDGVKNLLKYALGVGPMESPEEHLPRPVIFDGDGSRHFVLEFIHNPDADVLLKLQFSSDLSAWSDVGFSLDTVETLPGSLARVRVQFVGDLPEDAGNSHFFRLQAFATGE